MTLDEFRRLPPPAQMLVVLTKGTFLAHRGQDEGGVNLYHLPDAGWGFLAEVSLDEVQDCFVVLRSFSSSVPLEDYAHYMQLPGWGA